MRVKYNRILLKLSGEALAGHNSKSAVNSDLVNSLVSDISELVRLKVQVGLVIGGGNFFRGRSITETGLVDRITGDQIGMLATIINSLIFRDSLERKGVKSVIMSAVQVFGMVDFYDHKKAVKYLENNTVVIFSAGTGNSLVTTDSAASLRAIEIGADVLLKATQVDGIYPVDPKTQHALKHYKRLTYKEVLAKELAVMDLNAFIQCRDYGMKIIVFNIHKPHSLLNIVYGKQEGTLVDGD